MKGRTVPGRIWAFYRDGFRSMTLGRVLWLLILIKLFVMFGILRLFFFPDVLGRLGSDRERAEHVMEQLTTTVNPKEKCPCRQPI